MKMETDKPAGIVFTELLFKNLFWYLIFAVVYAEVDPNQWWLIQNMWGRIIIIFLELGILTSIFNDKETK